MIGQVSTPTGGGGIIKVPSLKWAARVWTPSTSVSASKTTGIIRKARTRTVRRIEVSAVARLAQAAAFGSPGRQLPQ